MAEPQFGFCTSGDGTRIAYATYGEGPRLRYSPLSLGMDSSFTIPESRALFDALASRMTLATYDRRGTGASDHGVEVSGELLAQDLAAVVDALNWQTFSLFANNAAILSGAAYAIAQPERVTRLIWWNTVYGTRCRVPIPWIEQARWRRYQRIAARALRRCNAHRHSEGAVRLQEAEVRR